MVREFVVPGLPDDGSQLGGRDYWLARGGPGLGTCLGPARTEALLRNAGFQGFERLDIKSPTNLFYAARP